ncbi:ExeA family protein [Methylococcus sp. EFPC2]|uniref:ExeA family protein n=1 Tax=Methylococcus sp. EFPC2 TaxID=2812648 RepID=UPI0019688EFF|nr:AAA family ATPase [Methylococcus sp. EFPC2]QSA97586.1 AAA family ATPase [Methylococcus sp. EFPC2]
MYESYYQLKEKPFALMPDPAYLYLSRKHRIAKTLLVYGILNQAGFVVVSGGIGTGKTTLIHQLLGLMNRKNMNVGLISNAHPSFGELMQWVLMAFNLDYSGKGKTALFQTFMDFVHAEYQKHKRTVLIIDEAQNLSLETLEELRMLINVNVGKDQLLQIVLVGQEQLLDKLNRPELEQFAQRISVSYKLDPLDRQETHNYIHHRLKVAGSQEGDLFTDDGCDAVFQYSRGIPRLINVICDNALVYGFADDQKHIDANLVHEVVKDRELGGLTTARADAGA